MADNNKKGKFKIGSIIRNLVLILAVGIFCYSGYQLITIYMEYKEGSDEYQDLEKYVDVAANSSNAETEKQIPEEKKDPDVPEETEINMEETNVDEFGTVIIGDLVDSEELEDTEQEGSEAHVSLNENETTQSAESSDAAEKSKKEKKATPVIEEKEDGSVKILGKIGKVKKRVDFEELKKINPEIIGWLYVEAIDEINYPIVQTDDNAYYLSHTFKKTDNIAGSIFLDCDTKPNFTEANSVIYGHNMKNGSMFGKLNQFYEEETYEKSKYFWIYTEDLYYKYEIFSCTEVGAISESYQRQFETKWEFEDYLKRMQENSVIKTDTELTSADKIVTLSTCTASSDVRFVVQGKLVRAYQVVDPDKTKNDTEK